MKLTAQFVARSGKSFLTGITTREMRNPQFDFLKPQHSLFAYFQHLVEAYTRIMNPPKALMDRIHTTDFNVRPHTCLARFGFLPRPDWSGG